MSRYWELKAERDEAVARAIEAERLSMKSEFDRVSAEFEEQKSALLAQMEEEKESSYRRGYNEGLNAMLSAACNSCRTLTMVDVVPEVNSTTGRIVFVEETSG